MAAEDAFNRLRVSNPVTTFDYYASPFSTTVASKIDAGDWVTAGDGGTIEYDSGNFISLPTNGGSTYSIRTTKRPMIYQPGKSRLFYMSGVMLTTTGVATDAYMGAFNVDSSTPPNITEGHYFHTDGAVLYFGETTQSGETLAAQPGWNIDVFDGSGPSGKTLVTSDLAKTMLLVFDQEWLGVGRIRCGFIIDGVTYYCHEFVHRNLTVQYTKTPMVRMCYYSTGAINTMKQMCCTCISEGGYYPSGLHNSVSTKNALIALNANEALPTILLAMRIQSGFSNGMFNPLAVSIFANGSTNKQGYYEVQMVSSNGPIGGSSSESLTYSAVPNSIVEIAQGNVSGSPITLSSDGYVVKSGFVDTKSSLGVNFHDYDTLLSRSIFTQYDTLYVVGYLTVNGTMSVAVNFSEHI